MQSAYVDIFIPPSSVLLRIQNDILSALNNKEMVVLVLLNLNTAFSTIGHKKKLLNHLNTRFCTQHSTKLLQILSLQQKSGSEDK